MKKCSKIFIFSFALFLSTKASLIKAIEKHDIEQAKLLIEDRTVDLDQTDNFGNTPLILALQNNLLDITRLLIVNGADVNRANNDGCTPLILACSRGHLDIVKLLVTNRADINKIDNYGYYPLFKALIGNNFSIVQYLISIEPNFDSIALIFVLNNSNLKYSRYLIHI